MVKAGIGIAHVLASPAETDGRLTITYYQPLTNWLSMVYILAVTASALGRVRIPNWVWAGLPVVVLSLLLSFRRSFWMAVLAGVLVLLLGRLLTRAPRQRAVRLSGLAAMTAAVALLGALAFAGVLPTDIPDRVRERASSFATSSIQSSQADSYRVGEQENIAADLRE